MRYFIVLGVIFLCGCLIRTYTIQKPRRDLDIEGNRGYIYGEPKEPPPQLEKTRKITVFEIELGPHLPRKIEEEKRIEVEKKVEIPEEEILKEEIPEEEIEEVETKEIEIPQEMPTKEYRIYTIKKNDTLQKISKKFYGTTRKWSLIYEENKDVIKDPDKIYPGLKIKIPLLR